MLYQIMFYDKDSLFREEYSVLNTVLFQRSVRRFLFQDFKIIFVFLNEIIFFLHNLILFILC